MDKNKKEANEWLSLYIYMPKWRYKNSNIRSKHKKLEQVLHEVFRDG